MEKHFLVTISEEKSARYGVKFLKHFFAHKADIELTLFFVAPKPASRFDGESAAEARSRIERQSLESREKGQRALSATMNELVVIGFDEKKIHTKLRSGTVSKISSIAQEAEAGRYDAVVFGKRALSWLESALKGSLSEELLDRECSFPVWICRKSPDKGRNVLIGVDGSEASDRMVDHVGYVLSQEERQKAVLCHVKKERETEEAAAAVIEKARDILLRNGLQEDRIHSIAVSGADVPKALLGEAEKGGYAAVALGRTGTRKRGLRAFLAGSVSEKLFRQLDQAALWFCY